MSRLIVKNLPAYITPARLRAHFASGAPGGTLTDAQVATKPDGTARRFGFVGYKTAEEAARAKEWFDRTFIDSTRISVSVVEDAPAPRPNKRRRVDAADSPGEPATDHQLDEFMQAMQPRNKKGPLWTNDAPSFEPAVPPGPDTAAHDTAISDLEWMKRRIGRSVDEEAQRAFEQSDDEDVAPDPAPEPEQTKDPTVDTIMETSRLFVRNLAFSCTEAELAGLFGAFGELTQVHVPVDINTKQHKGVAYVTFRSPAAAVAAYEALDRTSFQGRLLHVLGAVDRRGAEDAQAPGRKRTVKEEKHAQRRAAAGREFNWGMLYMNADAVASSVADRLNIDKSSILNPDDDEGGANAAVKLALAETHIIAETKTYLESQGVDLSAFSSARARGRSDTVILVKNIPYGTTPAGVRGLFEPHGALRRVLVPPAGTMAVVEFARADEAAEAFRAVAYRRLGNAVVYLEKAPVGLFAAGPSTDAVPVRGRGVVEHEAEEEGEGDTAGGATLYVKNLAFSTTQEQLVKAFRHLPSFAFARVQTKPDPRRPGARLSMGYGFVGFTDPEGARSALRALSGFVLDGHQLSVKFAGRGVEDEGAGKDKDKKAGKKTTKMVVKNVPFEATKKDIQALFGTHGHLKSVRVPRKFDARTRGFAFLDFVSRAEAESAYAALRHTHLLGRHLVLEWAEEGEDVEALRRRAGVGFGDGRIVPGRKRKIDMGRDGGDGDGDGLEG